MKFLVAFQVPLRPVQKRGIGVNQNIESAGEAEGGIETLLTNPLSFSVSAIKDLENAIEAQQNTLTSPQQQQFAKMVNYHLARFENEGEGTHRSRVLLALFRSPRLNQFLTTSQRQTVEALLNKERKELEKLGGDRKATDWKPDEAIRVARSYRFIRNRLNTKNLRINPQLKNTGDNLKLYAARLVEKSELGSLDQLFVIELSHIFPDANDWVNQKVYEALMARAENLKSDFQKKLAGGQNVPIDARYYWDTLEPTNGSEASEPLRNWLKRSAEVESLQAILNKDRGGEEMSADKVPLVLSAEEYTFLQRLENSSQDLTIDTNGETNRALETEKANLKAAQDKLDSLQTKKKDQAEALKQASPDSLLKQEKLGSDVKARFNNDWLKLDFANVENEEQQSKVQAFEAWREEAVKDIIEKQTEADEKELNAAKSEVDAASSRVKELTDTANQERKDMEVYQDPKAKAKEALENHKKYFTARLQNGRLVAADLDLMAQLKVVPGALNKLLDAKVEGKATAIIGLMTETRQAVEDTLKEEVQIESLDDLSEQELVKVDKFLSYEGVLKHIAATKTNKQASVLLRNFEALDQAEILDARQVITAVTLGIRRQVMAQLENKVDQRSGAYNEFLDNYARQHHAIHQTDRVEKMLGFSAEIEKEKQEKVKDAAEHAHEKISALFSKSEEAAIVEALNSILKTGISGSSVLNFIQSKLPEGEFVHNASDTKIKNYQRQIVSHLADKVTDENKNPDHLNQVAYGLLTRLAEMQSAQNAQAAIKTGAHKIEETDKEQLGVSTRLELARRTRLIYVEAADMSENLLEELDSITLALEKKEDADGLMSSFIERYKSHYKPRFGVLKEALVSECDLLFGERMEFTTNLDTEIDIGLRNLDLGIEQMETSLKDPNTKISATDSGFKKLVAALNNEILPLYNLGSGPVAKAEEQKINSTLENSAHTHKFVRDKLEVMQPQGAEKGRKNYAKQLEKYTKTVTNFSLAWDEAKKRLEKDLRKYNEDEFMFKHKMPKKAAREIIRTNDKRKLDSNWALDYFKGQTKESPYAGPQNSVFNRWLADYENPDTQPRALHFMNHFQDFENTLGSEQENFAKETEEMQAFRRDFDNNKPTLWLKKSYSIHIKWYTLKSIYMMVKQYWEFRNKRFERMNDRMASELGAKIFGDTPTGREFARDSNEKQDQRVSDFKNVHKSSNYQQLFKIIEKAKDAQTDKDEVQAAVELIMEKGELRWDNADFLNMLGRLQDVVTFDPDKDIKAYIENPAELKQKIGVAVTAIWDRPTWLQWKEDLPSKYKSRLDTHNNDYREEVQKGSVDTYLGNALAQWASGDIDTNFERSRFESYLKNAFDNGEMNGYPRGDRRWYYLIMGLTLKNPQGDTILSPDTLSRFGELQNKMPFMDAFDDGNSWKKNGRVVPEGTPNAHKNWTYGDFQAWGRYFDGVDPRSANNPDTIKRVRRWLNETLLTTGDAQDRMAKIQLTGLDRDDAGILPLLVSAERLRDSILRYSSGDKAPADDKYYVNLLTSFSNNFADSVEYMQHILNNEDKDAEGYEKRKKEQLLRFGAMMRSYFMISQVLAGNWDTEGSVGAVNLSENEWQGNNGADHYAKISKAVQAFTGDESLKIIDGKRYNQQKSTNANKYDTKDPEHRQLMFKVRDTFNDNDSYWTNVDRIEAFIKSGKVNEIMQINV